MFPDTVLPAVRDPCLSLARPSALPGPLATISPPLPFLIPVHVNSLFFMNTSPPFLINTLHQVKQSQTICQWTKSIFP